MKLLKKLTVLCMSLSLCLGAAAMLTACDKDDAAGASSSTSSSAATSDSEKEEQGYSFKLVDASGNPVKGYFVQLCYAGGDSCIMPSGVTDANGEVFYEIADITKAYDIHLLDPNQDTVPATGFVCMGTIPANYTGGVIEIQLN